MAGIDKSDFQPSGRPQFSSTVGPHVGGAESGTRREYRDVGIRTDTLPMVSVRKAVFEKHWDLIIPAVCPFHVCSESNLHQFNTEMLIFVTCNTNIRLKFPPCYL